jgi:Rod binding domain-containing protein
MTIPALHPKIEASDIPMEQLSGNKTLTEDQKIGEATRQFEAVLLRQILESTQKTVIQSKYADNSMASGIYRDMVTNQLADSISKSGTMGLGETLKHEFTRQLHSKATDESDSKEAAAATQAKSKAAHTIYNSAKATQTQHTTKELKF